MPFLVTGDHERGELGVRGRAAADAGRSLFERELERVVVHGRDQFFRTRADLCWGRREHAQNRNLLRRFAFDEREQGGFESA